MKHNSLKETVSPAVKAVAIGASAGGIPALEGILASLPIDLAASVFIVLHQKPDRQSLLVPVLQRKSHLHVVEAKNGLIPEACTVYVVPPGFHCELNEDRTIRLFLDGKMNHSRPSLIPTFKSVAERFGKNAMVVVLTGHGKNGAGALLNAKSAGAEIIAQDPNEAHARSMPEAAIATGTVDQVLSLKDISKAIRDFCDDKQIVLG